MGLLNNNDYIDPFKGSDYIDPSSNAERLSNQVNRDHARRESYVQRRYVKPAQSDQASRDRRSVHTRRHAPNHVERLVHANHAVCSVHAAKLATGVAAKSAKPAEPARTPIAAL